MLDKELRIIEFMNWYLLLGLAVYAVSFILWLFVLRHIPLTIAFSSMALNFVFMPMIAHKFFGEPYNISIALGSLIIIAGILITGISLMRES